MIPLIPAEEVASISIWKEITKSYRYEMKPTKKQEVKSIKTLEILRHIYNWSLGERKDGWKNGGWSVKYKDQQGHLKRLRNGLDKENKELGKELLEIYEQVEQNQLKRVDFAYERYFERVKNNKKNPKNYKKPGYPRFKGRNRMKSLTFPQYGNGCHIVDKYGNEDLKGDFIKLSKIGIIPFIKHVEIGDAGIPHQIKTITVKREVDKWIFIPVIDTFVEIEIPVIHTKPVSQLNQMCSAKKEQLKLSADYIKPITDNKTDIKTVEPVDQLKLTTVEELKLSLEELNKKCVGNDMGLPNLIIDSNEKKIEAPKYLDKSAKRLRKEQQKLSRKKRYDIIDESTGKVKRDPKTDKKLWRSSKNRDKQVEKVAKIHRRIKNQRRNFDHTLSKGKVRDNDLNVFEKLPIQKMMKDRRYSKRIADSGWSQLQKFTSYKAEWAGKIVDFVDPVYTSQGCSRCGRFVGKMQNTASGNGSRLTPTGGADEVGYRRSRAAALTCCHGETFKCPFCKLEINVHVNAGRNIRNRSEVYRSMVDKNIYQKLSEDMKEKIRVSEKRLMDNIYCWSLDPEDGWSGDRINRDAAARIYAFGEVVSTHMETYEQVISLNKEAVSKKGGVEDIENTISQAAPFRAR